jgi:hypothetical protein
MFGIMFRHELFLISYLRKREYDSKVFTHRGYDENQEQDVEQTLARNLQA